MTEPTPRCPWCSAALPAGTTDSCPTCGATLNSATGAEPDIKGVTSLDPMAIIQARSEVSRSRNRLMSFITGEAPGEAGSMAPESLSPPPDDVRREMLRLAIEAERADLEAETIALKTDVVVEMGIPLSALGRTAAGSDTDATTPADPPGASTQAEAAPAPAPGSPAPGSPAPGSPAVPTESTQA